MRLNKRLMAWSRREKARKKERDQNMSTKIEYVVGFLRSEEYPNRVALIEKHRPEWQKGHLNGIGGQIKPGETPLQAMRRKFREEAGLNIEEWELGVQMDREYERVFFFSAWGPRQDACTQTDEKIRHVYLDTLPLNVILNLRWLITLCFDDDIDKPIYVHDTNLNGARIV